VVANSELEAVVISGEDFGRLLVELPEFKAAVDALLRQRTSTI
jgi:hypothetical protein